jgi:hypothetical protein
VMRSKVLRLIALVTTAVTLMGADSCGAGNPGNGDQENPVATGPYKPPTPKPNPDTRPTRLPSPKPADPEAGYEHRCRLSVTWTPSTLFVLIEYRIGPKRRGPMERRGGSWVEDDCKVYGDHDVWVHARWTVLSKDNKRTPPGILTCLAELDNVVDADTAGGPNGEVDCLVEAT